MILIAKFREFRQLCNEYAKYTLLLATLSIPLSTSLMNFFFPLTIFLVLIGNDWKTKWQVIRMNPFLPTVMLLFGIYILGLIYTTALWSAAFKELVKYDKLLLFPFLLPLLVEDRWRFRVLAVFLIAVFITLLAGYLQYFQIMNLSFFHLKNFGAASVFKNRSTANLLMSISVYIALLSAIHFKKFRWYLLIYAFFATIFVCFLSDGRIGYLVLFSLLLLLGWQWKSWSGLVLSLLALTLIFILAYILPTPLSNRIHDTAATLSHTNQTEISTVERTNIAKNTMTIIKAHPILGSGTESMHYLTYNFYMKILTVHKINIYKQQLNWD